MSKMREEFESWYSDFDGYGEAHKKELWDTWKASRAALYVELPKVIIAGEIDCDAHVFEVMDVIVELNDSGVSYKK